MSTKKGKRLKNDKRNEEEETPKALSKDKKIREDEIQNKNKKRKKPKKGKHPKLKKAIIIIIIIIIIILAVMLGISSHRWKTLAQEMLINENSIVIDVDGKEIAKLGCERKNEKISFGEIPKNLKNAYISIEDERFYSHGGIDIKRTAGAIASYIIHFGSSSFGGSTITQQLVKNLTGDSSDSIFRKVKEWWKAIQLETCLSKDDILEGYLNIIYVGPNMYGVETGAKYYFNKSAKDLTLEECAFLAGINHSPNSYNPFEGKDNAEKIKNRTKTVLNKMLELGYINEEEYNQADQNVDRGLNFQKGTIQSEEPIYSYHTDALILEITEDIEEKYNISEDFATNYLNMAGLTIYSNQDSKVQDTVENEFEKSKYSLASKNGGNSSQAAMVIIDHSTGYITACTGGLGEKTTVRSLNRATQSIRQTGSSIKPLSVLAPAIDKKIITAASIYDDTERDFAGRYHPTDYNKSLGKITVRRAVESSQNIPFVEIMEELKPSNAIPYLEKMGISTLTEEDNSLVLALGGLQNGISPLEMAGAYSTIANDGEYIDPTFYNKIDNHSGKTILRTSQKRTRVFSKEVAYILKEILTQPVVGQNGTATYCKISGVDVAAKTGTTDENYDRWLCGFTPYYTAVTWYGFDQNESIDFNNRNPAGLLWANVMSKIHAGLQTATFEKPNAVQTATICATTGKRARSNCPNTYTEYFLKNTVPGLCNEHSGSEYTNTSRDLETTDNRNTIVQNITQDIDAEEPPRTTPPTQSTKNTTTINSTNNSSNSVRNDMNKTTNNTNNTNKTVNNTTNNNKNRNNTNSNASNKTNSITSNTAINNTNTSNTVAQNSSSATSNTINSNNNSSNSD